MSAIETRICERCGVMIIDENEAILSPDEICQECWETECAEAWWEMWPVITAIDAAIEAEREEAGE